MYTVGYGSPQAGFAVTSGSAEPGAEEDSAPELVSTRWLHRMSPDCVAGNW